MMIVPLEVVSVSKRFGKARAVSDVDLTLHKGEILGLLGPNGSGKSTTMKMIVGILKPDSGAIYINGNDLQVDPVGAKRIIGYIPESPLLYEFLTGVEYLDFVGSMYDIDPAIRKQRIEEFLEAFQIADQQNDMISGYSLGMRQKLALTAALLHRPKLLILDEALNGLDPRSAKIVKDLLTDLTERDGVAVLFSTHVLKIAESICDRVAIMERGSILAEGTVAELQEKEGLRNSDLEEVFLKLTGTEDLREVVEAISR